MPLSLSPSITDALMYLKKLRLTKLLESMSMPPLITRLSFTGERV